MTKSGDAEELDLLTGLLRSQYAGTQAAVEGAKLLPDARTRARARQAQEMLRLRANTPRTAYAIRTLSTSAKSWLRLTANCPKQGKGQR